MKAKIITTKFVCLLLVGTSVFVSCTSCSITLSRWLLIVFTMLRTYTIVSPRMARLSLMQTLSLTLRTTIVLSRSIFCSEIYSLLLHPIKTRTLIARNNALLPIVFSFLVLPTSCRCSIPNAGTHSLSGYHRDSSS